jgi:hypothetical protein
MQGFVAWWVNGASVNVRPASQLVLPPGAVISRTRRNTAGAGLNTKDR